MINLNSQFVPSIKKHHSGTLSAKGCEVLPFTTVDDGSGIGMVTNWKVNSFIARLIFLFKGELSLLVRGESHPPVALFIGDIVSRERD